MTHKYTELDTAVRAAGFYTNGLEDHGSWDRTCVCAKRYPNGHGYSGNSFWVTLHSGKCFLGTWGGAVYLLPDQERLAELCISWLTRVPDGTRPDFDSQVKSEFGLIPVSGADFDSMVTSG